MKEIKKALELILDKIDDCDSEKEIDYYNQAIALFDKTNTIRVGDQKITKRELYCKLLSALHYFDEYDKLLVKSKEALDIFEIKGRFNRVNGCYYAYQIAMLLQNNNFAEAYQIYKNYELANPEPDFSPFMFEESFSNYEKILNLKEQLGKGKDDSTIYYEIAYVYWENLGVEKLAFDFLDKALSINPNHIKSHLLKLDILDYQELESFENLKLQYEKLLTLSGNHPDVIRAYIAFLYPRRDEVTSPTAIDLSLALIQTGESVDYEKLAAFYEEIDDEDGCFKALLNAEKQEKPYPGIYRWLAYHYEEEMDDNEKALEYFKKYRKYNSVWCGNEDEEIQEKINELSPNKEDLNLSRYERRKKKYLAQAKENPTPEIYLKLARNEIRQGDNWRPRVYAFYDKGLELDPNHLEILGHYAEYLTYVDPPKAIGFYKRLVVHHPEPFKFWKRMGHSYLRNEQLEEALDCYIRNIESHYSPEAHTVLSVCKKLGKDPLPILEQAVEKSPHPETYQALADLYFKNQAYEKSFAAAMNYIKHDKNGYGFMDLANIFFKEGLFEEAKELYTLIYEERNNEHVDEFKLLNRLGVCCLKLNELGNSKIYFAKALKEDKERAEAYQKNNGID